MKKQLLLFSLFCVFVHFGYAQKKPSGTQKFMRFSTSEARSKESRSSVQAKMKNFFGLDTKSTFKKLRTTTTKKQLTNYKEQQYYKGLPVVGGVLTTTSRKGRIIAANAMLYNPKELSLTPTVSLAVALQKGLSHLEISKPMWEEKKTVEFTGYQKPTGTLMILPDRENKELFYLVYKLDIWGFNSKNHEKRHHLYIDAHTGKVVLDSPIIKHATGSGFEHGSKKRLNKREKNTYKTIKKEATALTTAQAETKYSGTQTIYTDNTIKLGTWILASTDNPTGVLIQTFDANNEFDFSKATVIADPNNDNTWTATEFPGKKQGELDAHWGAKQVYDYWWEAHGRNSFDAAGASIRSLVHVGTNHNNAYWNGSYMLYGDGSSNGEEGNGLLDISTSLDICAHELGHAVTDYTSDLIYEKESGALNEAFSDIWAAVIEYRAKGGNITDPNDPIWLIGDQIDRRTGSPALRSMSHPKLLRQPDTYEGSFWVNQDGCNPSDDNDYCGVHTNSGVLNHWFYILVAGKSGTNDMGTPFSVSGIGMEKAAEIAYQTLLTLPPTATYIECRNAAIEAARNLYPDDSDGIYSFEARMVQNAFAGVNVGARYDCDPLEQIVLEAPANGTVDMHTINLDWKGDGNASEYVIEVATDTTFTTLVKRVTVYKSSYSISGLPPDILYYWRVKSKNDCYETTFSEAFSFTTGDYVFIPDENFLQALLIQGVDINGNGTIQQSEAETITKINISGNEASDLTGIGAFVNLEELKYVFGRGRLESLDLTQNKSLKSLICYNNQLKSINISENLDLVLLNCDNNELTNLDVSGNINLTNLSCSFNQLTSLDVSKNIALEELNFRSNRLSSIDVTKNLALVTLICPNNQLTSLDVSKNSALVYLGCYYNELTSLNLNQNLALEGLHCGSNRLSSLDVTQAPNLIGLDCEANQLTSLDVSQNLILKRLNCHTNRLTNLNVTQNLALTFLGGGSNQLSSLDVSKNLDLEELRVGDNQLLSLDLTRNSALNVLACQFNRLSNLDAKNGNNENFTLFSTFENPNLYCILVDDSEYSNQNWVGANFEKDDIAIYSENCALEMVNIPDANFEQRLINLGIDGVLDGQIFRYRAEAITDTLDLSRAGISNLEGIEAFVNITGLNASRNSLTNVDISENRMLVYLNFKSNILTSLDVSQNEALTHLDISSFGGYKNKLTQLDVSHNPALTYLNVQNNQLTNIDLSTNTNLTNLSCGLNKLTQLDVSKNTALTFMSCSYNQLTSLDVSQNTALTELYVHNNQLTSLDTSNNINLTSLIFFNNQLTALDVSANTNLASLNCSGNQLTSLDVTQNTVLTYLSCSTNQLTELDISNNTALTTLYVNNNQLTSLDTSNNINLTSLNCSNNLLGNLNLQNGNNTSLSLFKAEGNPNLSCIQVDDADYSNTHWTTSRSFNKDDHASYSEDCLKVAIPDPNFEGMLISLGIDSEGDARNGYILRADAEAFTGTLNLKYRSITDLRGIEAFVNLTGLDCSQNWLTDLDVSRNTALKTLDCTGNRLTSLDLSKNTALEEVTSTHNFIESIDVSQSPLLKKLNLYRNQLTQIDVSQNNNLQELNCSANLLTRLDVSQNRSLTKLWSLDNQLTELNVANGNNVNMTFFNVSGNSNLGCIQIDAGFTPPSTNWFKDETASYNEDCMGGIGTIGELVHIPDGRFERALISMGIDSDRIENQSISRSDAEAVTGMLDLRNKDISDLTGIEAFINLTELDCTGNNLTSLDVSKNLLLEKLSCGVNELSSLDVSQNTALIELSCSSNPLNTLDVSANINLTSLGVSNTQLTNLDVSFNLKLEVLDCHNSQLTNLDASELSQLKYLYCQENQLTSLDLTQNTALINLNCNANQLTALDLSTNTNLISLSCESNQLTALDLSTNTNLTSLSCGSNQLTNLDVSQQPNLTGLSCEENQLTSLDLSSNSKLLGLSCQNNLLSSLNLQNGNNANMAGVDISNNSSLSCVQIDAGFTPLSSLWQKDSTTNYSTNCPPFQENVAPTVDVLTPSTEVVVDDLYTITWADSDPDDNAQISLFYDTDNSGEDGMLIASGISEDESSDSYTWNVSRSPEGAVYYIYAKIEDGVNPPVYAYSEGKILINHSPENTPPTINILEPSADGIAVEDTYTITWTDSDPDDNAQISLFYDTDNSGENGTLIVSGISEDESSDSYTWDTSQLPEGLYYVYAKIEDVVNSPVYAYSSGSIQVSRTTENPCPTNSSLCGVYTDTQTIQAKEELHTGDLCESGTTTIQPGANILARAGKKILLRPGFKANMGSYFKGQIVACESSDQEVATSRNALVDNSQVTVTSDVTIYPNPFNGTTTIAYAVSEQNSSVEIHVYDVMGRLVKVLVQKNHSEGLYNASFNAENLPDGVYACKVRIGDKTTVKKIVKQ